MWRVARAAGGQDGSPAAFPPKQVVHRWYLGGLASAAAAACTHPLDLLKVHLQTQQEGKRGLWEMGVRVVQTQGVRGLYNGLTASLTRQLTYSTTRFGVYEVLKAYLLPDDGSPLPFHYKIVMGATGGFFGGIVGSPFDAVNVRMQNDMKLPAELRRNYKHVVDGVIRISKEEGALCLWNGSSMVVTRAVLITLSQIAFYEQAKQLLLGTGHFRDNTTTHFTSSFMAAVVATALTQPADVMKTRLQNAPPGTFSSLMHCFWYTAKTGPLGFFKGFIPAFVRLGPHTILTFIFLEKLRILLPPKS
jgi:dicarboxylate transporter 10